MLRRIAFSFINIFYANRLKFRISNKQKRIYLTFDDGPDPVITPQILEILDRFNIKASFFCLGSKVEKHPEIYQMLLNKGHVVGNHGYKHISGLNTNVRKYYMNAIACEKQIASDLFRPPFGRIKPCQAKALSRKFKIVMWSLMTKDYSSKMKPQKCFERIKKHLKPGDIIVFHDTPQAATNCLHALPLFIKFAKSRAYKFDVLRFDDL